MWLTVQEWVKKEEIRVVEWLYPEILSFVRTEFVHYRFKA